MSIFQKYLLSVFVSKSPQTATNVYLYHNVYRRLRAKSQEKKRKILATTKSILLVSQRSPVYPGMQLHEKSLVPSTHVAPLAQEWLAQSSISIKITVNQVTVNSKKRSSSLLTSLYLKLRS